METMSGTAIAVLRNMPYSRDHRIHPTPARAPSSSPTNGDEYGGVRTSSLAVMIASSSVLLMLRGVIFYIGVLRAWSWSTRDGATMQAESSERLELSLAHLLPVFGPRTAVHITSADVTGYSAKRLEEGAAAATVNRELSALKRAFSLAVKGERLQRISYMAMLRENNVRTGFVEPPQLEAIQRHLPDYAKAAILFSYITGWPLRSETLQLQWRQSIFGPAL